MAGGEDMDERKILRVRFVIPVKYYKGSNTNDVPAVSRSKSQWLRRYGEQVWSDAIRRDFGIVADEPDDWKKSSTAYSPSEQKTHDAFTDQDMIVETASNLVKTLEADHENIRTTLHDVDKKSYEHAELKAQLASIEDDLKTAKRRLQIESKLLTKTRNAFKTAHSRQDSRRSRADRKSYIKEKSRLNEGKLLFPGRVTLDVRSNIITAHDFDAPNCWPSVKPLQDGGTDTCILWHDDNNNFITRTSFYGGGKEDSKNYVIDMIVREDDGDGSDPFRD